MAPIRPRSQETRATGTIDERDALTGTRGYYTLLRDFEYDTDRDDDSFIALCDVDDFRTFNEAYGENRCNDVLAQIGSELQRSFGDDHVFRYASDEFLIVNSFSDEAVFRAKLDELRPRIGAIAINDRPLHITCSFGYVMGKITDSDALHEAIRLADRKMYEAKRMGKARAVAARLEADPVIVSGHRHSHKRKAYEIDELTGLTNLVFFRNELERLLEDQPSDLPDEQRLALVYFNIQNFKAYNQQFGFDAGDALLILIGDAIQDAFPGQLASRFSADQFMVVATQAAARDGFKKVRMAFRNKRKDTSIWLRAGLYVPEPGMTDVVLSMDRAKLACDSIRGRRDIFLRCYDDELQSQIAVHRYVLDNFDEALAEGWVQAFYQPIARVATGNVCDVEALARWNDPERGIISPADFVPVLEDARLIHRLDLHVLACVCDDFKRLSIEDGYIIAPSINLSRLDFELCDIVEEVTRIVDEHEVPRSLIAVEVTESALSGNREFLKEEIDRFRERGFEVWMDDFGNGYSSLNLLKEYNFDLLKIDMGFLSEFESNESTRVILSHIISMAKEIGLKTLAEGVETDEQFQFLRSIGCGRAQGWAIGRPQSLDDTIAAIEAQSYPAIEKFSMRGFYESVGRMNMIRPNPTEPIDGHYVPGDSPSVIVERVEGRFRFLNVSETYLAFLHSLGIESVDQNEQLMYGDHPVFSRVRESIDDAVTSGRWERRSFADLGVSYSSLVKCIASNPEEDAVSAIIIMIGTFGRVVGA